MLHLMVTHFDATLGMGGWLDLTQQGLSPCKKYRASWRSLVIRFSFLDNTKYKIGFPVVRSASPPVEEKYKE